MTICTDTLETLAAQYVTEIDRDVEEEYEWLGKHPSLSSSPFSHTYSQSNRGIQSISLIAHTCV